MDSLAEMSCALKVNVHCEVCKRKLMEVLQNLHGVYSVAIDAEKGTVKISGRVNPNLIMRILQNNGKHAEVTSIQFDGEVVVDHFDYYSYYGENGYMNNYLPRSVAYPYPFLMGPEHPCYGRGGPQFLPPPLPPPPLLQPAPLLPMRPRPPPPLPPPPPPISESPSVPKEVAPPPSKKEPECICNIM